MKDLLICVLALTWVLVVIRQMGTRRYPRETADHIDRDFRDLVDRAHHKATAVPWYLSRLDYDSRKSVIQDLVDRAHRGGHTRCPVHGPQCPRAVEAKRTGLSQTDQDVARRAALSNGASTH